eukprot:gnl/MRDRNA2_/MRDRNA2_107401_c0_seq1.p1 gnl/MRDRNA2_/MRDRNA2_107401_c0~~gnl/MRDRNA2_/MRDRNA2_107401_c0_seq1.p1  ORF type:complete len:337 (+),score=104.00 gnl/MRDRNA2_/MRDRNA2_107401_c0_seq1:94-1104(+)
MASTAEKLNILVIQHLEHVGVSEDIITPLKTALENGKTAEGSSLYELVYNASKVLQQQQVQPQVQPEQVPQGRRTVQGQQPPPQQQQPPQGRMTAQGVAPPMQQQRMSAQMSGSVAYNAQQAAMMQQQLMQETKPVIAKEPDVRNPKLDAELMAAAKAGKVDSIPSIITSGAYVNMQDEAGTSPLLAATEADKVDVVKVLLQNGADVNLAKPDGTSPLLCAYKGNKKKVLKELTAGAFRTLNTAVHQHGSIGGNFMYDPVEEEGVTMMDMCQLKDETGKLFKLQAHPPEVPPSPVLARKESMVQIGGEQDVSNLAAGSVRLLMQELVHVSQKPTSQ